MAGNSSLRYTGKSIVVCLVLIVITRVSGAVGLQFPGFTHRAGKKKKKIQSPVHRSCWMNRDEAMIVASSLAMDLSFDESNNPRVAAKSHHVASAASELTLRS